MTITPLKRTASDLCKVSLSKSDPYSIDNNEFILLNLEGPLTCKQPTSDESIGAFTTINMGYKQFMHSNQSCIILYRQGNIFAKVNSATTTE